MIILFLCFHHVVTCKRWNNTVLSLVGQAAMLASTMLCGLQDIYRVVELFKERHPPQ